MKNKQITKITVAILLLVTIFSSLSLFTKQVCAASLNDWRNDIKSYYAQLGYLVNGEKQERWLFYDTDNSVNNLKDINCIRSGDRQNTQYERINLYELPTNEKNVLFKTEEDYLHFMWILENMYLMGDNSSNKMDKYNAFIGATNSDLPYGSSDVYQNKLNHQSSGGLTGEIYTVSKNEQLIKLVQNEMLLQQVIQSYDRKVDLNTIYEFNHSGKTTSAPANSKVQNYAAKITAKFNNKSNSKNYTLNNINKNINGSAKVTIESTSEDADSLNNISGSFLIVNNFNANITDIRVFVNNTKLENTSFKFIDSTGKEITNIKDVLTKNKSSEFRIQYEGLNTGNNTVKVELDVDYGIITEAFLFKPLEDKTNDKNNQYLVNVARERRTDTVSTENKTEAKEFDLALTKEIVEVKDQDGTTPFKYKRLFNIAAEALKDKKGTNARYIMQKEPVRVEVGNTVTYSIKVYNEGEIDGFAEEITDYLPNGLKFLPNSTVNTKYGWVDNGDGTVSTKYLSSNSNENSSNILKAFSGEFKNDENTKTVLLECEVVLPEGITGDINSKNIILDNRAEITEYGYYADANADGTKEFVSAKQEGVDRDSVQNSALEDAGIKVDANNPAAELIEKISKIINEKVQENFSVKKDDKNKISYEDDDDIERLRIVEDARYMDLALRKWITKIDNTEYNRQPSQLKEFEEGCTPDLATQMDAEGTLAYDNPKLALELTPGSIVTYKIAVFNEGSMSSYAQEITDYLPKGLEFIKDNEINIANGWVATENSDGTTTVKTNILSEEKGKVENSENSNLLSTVLEKYLDNTILQLEGKSAARTVEIVCKVSDDIVEDIYLTNRAEITVYGYYDKAGNFVEASKEGIDRDSEQDTIKEELDLENWYEIWYSECYDKTTPKDAYPGVQDDDDFEAVFVKVIKGKYSLQIKKVNSLNNETIDGVRFLVNNTKTKLTKNGIVEVSKQEFYKKDLNIVDKFEISEIDIEGNGKYLNIQEPISVYVRKGEKDGKYVVTSISFEKDSVVDKKVVKLEDNSEVTVTLAMLGDVIEVTIPNKPTDFDLSLRKFISSINGKALEGEKSREPLVDTEKLLSGEKTTAEYTHTKEAILVNPSDIVEYTIRIYNEGGIDGFANRIMDDIPEGVEMIAPTYDEDGNPTNINAQYGWVMYKEYIADEENADANQDASLDTILMYNEKMYIKTEKTEEAVLIVTSHLSKENGELNIKEDGKNPNLLEKLNVQTGILDSKDVKVEFKVKNTNEADKIITNYAQISEQTDENGSYVKDIDSTPNKWNDGEDDQDIENIKVAHFDLNLYKWVTTAIVIEDGKVTEYNSDHTELDKSKLVNVVIPKDKLNKVTVKFKYKIKVGNEGIIPGYATEIKDHIPQGLKFVAEDNIEYGWILEEDGTITTDYLKDTLLKTNETAEIEVVLTWINSEDNFGEKNNFAEISKDYNEYGDTPDIDSTPNNFKGECVEDDEDNDIVMLQIRTGEVIRIQYIALAIGVIAIITTGIISIKKFVLE